ncbi:hypothetical protein Prudu_232S000400, partial [Prunus dulcis]
GHSLVTQYRLCTEEIQKTESIITIHNNHLFHKISDHFIPISSSTNKTHTHTLTLKGALSDLGLNFNL